VIVWRRVHRIGADAVLVVDVELEEDLCAIQSGADEYLRANRAI
jgi:hypothetical protein